jgi:hypothetical protein
MRRWSLSCLAAILVACTSSPASVAPTPSSTQSVGVADDPRGPVGGEGPSAGGEPGDGKSAAATVEEPPSSEPVQAEPGEVWRFTTLVTGGPEPLVGANGYYELVLDGEAVVVRKVGERGTPVFSPERVMQGTGVLALTEDPAWPSARTGEVTVTLTNASSKITMGLSVWVMGDELHGVWTHPHAASEALMGRAWGLLQGTRGRGEPAELVDGKRAPCSVCVEAFWNCEGMGSDACNSGNLEREACARQMKAARKKSAEVPRGCGEL